MLGKYKNFLLSVIIIAVSFFAVRAIYEHHAGVLKQVEKRKAEVKKIAELVESWTTLHNDNRSLKNSIMYTDDSDLKKAVEKAAKAQSINITSLRPRLEDKKKYQLGIIDLAIIVPSYRKLAEFIKELEESKVHVGKVVIRRGSYAQSSNRRLDLNLKAYVVKSEKPVK